MDKLIKLDRKALGYALAACKKVIVGNAIMPILLCVRFVGDGKTLKIGASCIQVYVESTFDSGFVGGFCVNLASLMKVLKIVKDDEVSMEFEPDGPRLRVGDYVLPTMDIEEFPCTEVPGAEEAFSMDADKMVATLKRCRPFMSSDPTRYSINGIGLKLYGDDTVRFGATDGHRLIMETVSAESKKNKDLFVQASAVDLLTNLAKACDIVEVLESKEYVLFRVGNSLVVVRKVDSSFPDLGQVIPSNPMLTCEVDRSEMMHAMRGAMEISGCNGRVGATILDIKPDGMTVSVEVDGIGFEKKLECKASDSIEIGFNAKFVLEALDVLSKERVLLEIRNDIEGTKIVEDRITTVVMPIRINE